MKIEVKPSKVDGLGVFATADIGEGETVGLYEGQLMVLDPDDEPPTRHFLYLSDDEVTCKTCQREPFHFGVLGTGLLRYINSTQGQEAGQNVDMRRAFVVAVKPIAMGEELLMDYEFDG